MKFLDVARLNGVTSFLENCTVGDRRLTGRVEAYSCKVAGDDKKLHKVLQQQFQEDSSYAGNAIGKLSDPHNRKLLINLICTMNATFPDYDFSGLKPDQFVKKNVGVVVNSVNLNLSEIVEKQNSHFLEELWGAIDQEIDLKQSEVFSYLPDVEDDPFNVPGSLWSFNFFFHNAIQRKIVFFTCCCTTSWRGEDVYGVNHDIDEEFNDFGSDTMSNNDDGDLLDEGEPFGYNDVDQDMVESDEESGDEKGAI